MTASEQIAFNNGFILGMATKGLIRGNTITRPYYNEPTLNQGVTMADRPLVGNDATIQNMIFNAKTFPNVQYFLIAYGMWNVFNIPRGPQWLVFFSNYDNLSFYTATDQMKSYYKSGDQVGIFDSNGNITETNHQRDIWDASKNKLPFIAYSTMDIVNEETSEIIMPAPYNLFG